MHRTPGWPLLLCLLGCTGSRPAPAPAPSPPPVAEASKKPAPPLWNNPGGMWLPQQMPLLAEQLKHLGLELDPAALSDVTRAPLAAVVGIPGCSASFVSNQGLIATNHHCVQGALQYGATPEHDYIVDGFYAHALGEEISAGPTWRAQVVVAIRDVTADMTGGLAALPSDVARGKALEDRNKALLAACEQGGKVRCRVVDFFAGALYLEYQFMELRDIRLVYASPHSVGDFGGEIDNWRWPRHTADFAFLRAYVGKDGQPADFSPDNVPYQPGAWMRMATRPLAEGDLVLVAGTPGRTSRLLPSWAIADTAEWTLPRSIANNQALIAIVEKIAASDKGLAIKAETTLRRLHNFLTKYQGQLETMQKLDLVARRAQADAELMAWIARDPARQAKYGAPLDAWRALSELRRKTREIDTAYWEIIGGSYLLKTAVQLVRMAENRPRKDEQREPEFQQRQWALAEQGLVANEKRYAPELDKATLLYWLERTAKLPDAEQVPIFVAIAGQARSHDELARVVDALYARTTLGDTATRVKLYRTATTRQLQRSKDPFIKLALATLPVIKAYEDRGKADTGQVILLSPLYDEAMREQAGGKLAPDANSTLRITFGQVKGPVEGGPGFTTMKGLLAKVGPAPFDAPRRLVDAGQQAPDLPLCFMSDTDITNGNSGSATLNARGELVGLAFDGTYDSVASDWVYLPNTRTIHVDLRYMLWLMQLDGMGWLVDEMKASLSAP